MAASNRFSESQGDEINECSICFDSFTNQRCLPCLHTFCLDCIKRHAAGRRVGESIFCPLCRLKFTIPRGGLDELPRNFWIDRLNQPNSPSGSSQDSDQSSRGHPRQNQYLPKLNSFMKISQTELAQLDVEKERFLEEMTRNEKRIQLRCADLKRLIEEQEVQLIQQVTSDRDKQLQAYSARRQQLGRHLTNLRTFKADSDAACARSANAHSTNDAETTMKSLGMTQVSLNNDKLPSIDVSFPVIGLMETNKLLHNLIGNLTVRETKGASANWTYGSAGFSDTSHTTTGDTRRPPHTPTNRSRPLGTIGI